MPDISVKSIATASILALATLPTSREHFGPVSDVPTPGMPAGHERLRLEGGFYHLVDWDMRPGIDTIVHEHGIRTGPLWSEFREWSASHGDVDIITAGNKACDLLTKHFGGFNERVAEALASRRALEATRLLLQARMDREYPPLVRIAAQRMLNYGSPDSYRSSPSSHSPLHEPAEMFGMWSETIGKGSITLAPSSNTPHSDEIVLEHILKTPELKECRSIYEASREIVDKVACLECELEVMDESIRNFILPDIPGEAHPADMDQLAFGSLVCRHRAVIVAVLLADAGYEVELVLGRLSPQGGDGTHLFIYSDSTGILESSCEGPEFWKKTVSVCDGKEGLRVTIEGGLVYEFDRRTPLNLDSSRQRSLSITE